MLSLSLTCKPNRMFSLSPTFRPSLTPRPSHTRKVNHRPSHKAKRTSHKLIEGVFQRDSVVESFWLLISSAYSRQTKW